MTTTEIISREFSALDDYLKAVRDILRDGHMPDMSGLDARVSALCSMLEDSERDIQYSFLPRLSEFLSKLDICENELSEFHKAQTKGHS